MLIFNDQYAMIHSRLNYLNTSHVNLQLKTGKGLSLAEEHLNTSHVNLQHHVKEVCERFNKFKYISC